MTTVRDGTVGIVRPWIDRVGMLVWVVSAAAIGLRQLFPGDRFARRRVVDALSDTALRPVPVITILAALVGVVLAFSISRALQVANFESVLLLALREALMREVMPLLVGIFVAGRSGVALCVRIGRMIAGGEVDSLRLMGVNPASHVLPAQLIAFLTAAAALLVWGIFIGHLAAALSLVQLERIPVEQYTFIVFDEAARKDLWFGLLRVEVYALLTLSIAASDGSTAGRDFLSIEAAARRTFVSSLIAIFAAAAVLSGLGA